MNNFEVRWRNFHGFDDTGWFRFKPLTLLIGPNNAGKSSLLAPLLMLRQTLRGSGIEAGLAARGELVNAGSYADMVLDHNRDKNISFALRWDNGIRTGDLKEVGHYPPGSLQVTFDNPEEPGLIRLLEYHIRDLYGRTMLRRKRTKSGSYSMGGPIARLRKGPSDNDNSPFEKEVRSLISSAMPHNFLFHGADVFAYALNNLRDSLAETDDLDVSTTPYANDYMSATSWAEREARRILNGISYLGPLRAEISRSYELSGEPPGGVGVRGETAPEIIHRSNSQPALAEINRWLAKFGLPAPLRTRRLDDGVFSLTVDYLGETNVADFGFGYSQILPLIVQSVLARKNSTTIMSQPELHLNPALQSTVAELLAGVVKRGATIIVETHSEHLLTRLRRLIAEGALSSDEVAVIFVERDDARSTWRPIPVDPIGHIPATEWPRGFFQEQLSESLLLASAQRQSKGQS